MLKDKKNIIILSLSVFLIVSIIVILIVVFAPKKLSSKNIDGSKLSSLELYEMFKEENYKIKITNIDGTLYINLENESEGITIQRIPNTLTGPMMTYDDDSINDKMADLIDLSRNNTEEKQQQYKAYQSWLKHYNITKTQLSEMLDEYYTNHKNETEFINTKELLNSFK